MSWPIILPIFAVGFVCGAVWMRARFLLMLDRRAVLIESAVDAAIREPNCHESKTAYCCGQDELRRMVSTSAGGTREVLTGQHNRCQPE